MKGKAFKVFSVIFFLFLGGMLFSAHLKERPKKQVNSPNPYTVVDTGQKKCYDNFKEISCPKPGQPFYGQDAQYKGHQPHYIDNGNGTITDVNTGL
ncbi:MAG: hypothetical protein J7L72_11125 [Candidatus Aminicenantes bacterium]|nr:hypothetical protein [Candidatus Aminicenantes bacterium]